MEKVVLSRGPFEIATASSGREAIARARAERPDLIVLDSVMPDMTGFEVLEEMRANGFDMRVIMVTSRGEVLAADTGFPLDFDAVVTRPISCKELFEKVRSALCDQDDPGMCVQWRSDEVVPHLRTIQLSLVF